MTIVPHKKIAIIGRSGNGKSTIFNLLLRYFDASKGTITIDGINIKELTEESLRNNISIIRQTPFLFNLSIIDNFRLPQDFIDNVINFNFSNGGLYRWLNLRWRKLDTDMDLCCEM